MQRQRNHGRNTPRSRANACYFPPISGFLKQRGPGGPRSSQFGRSGRLAARTGHNSEYSPAEELCANSDMPELKQKKGAQYCYSLTVHFVHVPHTHGWSGEQPIRITFILESSIFSGLIMIPGCNSTDCVTSWDYITSQRRAQHYGVSLRWFQPSGHKIRLQSKRLCGCHRNGGC